MSENPKTSDILIEKKRNTVFALESSEKADNDQRWLQIDFTPSEGDEDCALITISADGQKDAIVSFYILIDELMAQAKDLGGE